MPSPKLFDIPKAPIAMEYALMHLPLPEGVGWFEIDGQRLLPEMKQVDPEALLITAECVPTGRWLCYLRAERPDNLYTFGIALEADSDIPATIRTAVEQFQSSLPGEKDNHAPTQN